MRTRIATLLIAAVVVAAAPAWAQHPRIGIGAEAGAVLGAELMDHVFVGTIDGRETRLTQEVDLRSATVTGLSGEWYITRHVGLRVHGAWGSGELSATTKLESGESADPAAYQGGFGAVKLTAFDAGVSIWPWTPRSVGFAPYVTVGAGVFSYEFAGPDTGDAFFRASGTRSERAVIVGLGADMHIWQSVMLRMEATNHLVESPLEAEDFAVFGERRTSEFSERVSNIRLVLGAQVYFPFGGSTAIED